MREVEKQVACMPGSAACQYLMESTSIAVSWRPYAPYIAVDPQFY